MNGMRCFIWPELELLAAVRNGSEAKVCWSVAYGFMCEIWDCGARGDGLGGCQAEGDVTLSLLSNRIGWLQKCDDLPCRQHRSGAM